MPIQFLHNPSFRLPLMALTCILLNLRATAFSQAPAPPPPAFDVASITPNEPNAPIRGITGVMRTPDGVHAEYVTLIELIRDAWGSQNFNLDDQFVGLPDWAKAQHFNVEARVSDPDALNALTPEERNHALGLMLQSLLAERVELKLHTGSKQIAAYNLVVAKSGFKLKPDASADAPAPGGKPSPNGSFISIHNGKSDVHQYTISHFALFLSFSARELGHPVFDKTGVPGMYSFSLDWAPGKVFPAGATEPLDTSSPEATSIFTALQAVGLRLQPSTAIVDTLVIDHVAHPSAN